MEVRVKKSVALAAVAATLELNPAAVRKLDVRVGFLTRSGFPDGAPSGRGFRGGYTLDQFWQILLLFNLQRLGITLNQALSAVRTSWPMAGDVVDIILRVELDMTFHWVMPMPVMAGLEEFSLARSNPCIEHFAVKPGESFLEDLREAGIVNFGALNATHIVEAAASFLKEADGGLDLKALAHASSATARQRSRHAV